LDDAEPPFSAFNFSVPDPDDLDRVFEILVGHANSPKAAPETARYIQQLIGSRVLELRLIIPPTAREVVARCIVAGILVGREAFPAEIREIFRALTAKAREAKENNPTIRERDDIIDAAWTKYNGVAKRGVVFREIKERMRNSANKAVKKTSDSTISKRLREKRKGAKTE
jgi:hypothetical protein